MNTALFISGLLIAVWFFGIHHRIIRIFRPSHLSYWGKVDLVERFHVDLFNKIVELKRDPFMSDHKWKEWLPICRYFDQLLWQVLPRTRLISLGKMVSDIIQNSEEVTS